MDTNFTIKCSGHRLNLQRDNSIEADIFVFKSRHVSSFLFKRYWLKICILYNFINRSIENRDPLHRRSARRKTNSISDIVIRKFLITRSISLKKNWIQLQEKKNIKKVYMESKTVMLLNLVLMTTLILLYVKIQMVHLRCAADMHMSRFRNWKNSGISSTSILLLFLPHIANVTISKER